MSSELSLIFYVFSFLFVVMLTAMQDESIKKLGTENIILSILIVGIPTFISGLRYNVGADFPGYDSSYYSALDVTVGDYFSSGAIEPGFFLLQKMTWIFNNSAAMFTVAAFVTVYFTYKAIIYHREKISMAFAMIIFLFVLFPTSFNGVRQCLAVAVCFYAFRYITERKLKKYICFVLFATSFHVTAAVMLPFYVLGYKIGDKSIKHKKKMILLNFTIILFTMICTIFYQEITIALFSQSATISRYVLYANDIDAGNNREIILNIIVLLAAIIYRKQLINNDEKNSIYIVFFAISVIIGATGFINPFAKRLALYFDVVQVLILANLITLSKDSVTKITFGSLIAIYSLVYFVLGYYIWGQSNIFPYQTIFVL
ncbi:MAG: EpsG family protein [Bacillota bacterium]